MSEIGAELLKREYLKRKKRNPLYSMRRFAQFIGVPSGRLSDYFLGKRRITPSVANQVAAKLSLSPLETARLMGISTESECHNKKVFQEVVHSEVIADPMHFAVLCLFELADFKSSSEWMAHKLRVSTSRIESILQNLLEIGMLAYTESGYILRQPDTHLTSPDEVINESNRIALRKMANEAKLAYETVDRELRDFTATTLAIDPSRIDEAKIKIRQFKRELSNFLESGKQSEVYRVVIQMYPISANGEAK